MRIECFRNQVRGLSAFTCGLLVIVSVFAEPAEKKSGCSIQGTVRDPQGRAIKDVPVEVRAGDETFHSMTRTNKEGYYCFTSLPKGRYGIHAAGADRSDTGQSAIVGDQPFVANLTLILAKSSTARSNDAEFFDEPQFTVAGVTDTTNLGGHGSDTVVRTKDSMAKEIVGLSRDSKNSSGHSTNEINVPTGTTAASLHNFDDNRRLAQGLLASGREKEALPYLHAASLYRPGDPDNEFDLAAALLHSGDTQAAKAKLQNLLTFDDTAPVHHLLAEAEEKLNTPLNAVRHYQRAAELAPSETNLFDWGAELLLHHASEPAIEVFSKGVRQFPRSVRMRVGLGVAWYTRGSYDQAVQYLCNASDVDPSDSRPYLFLGKMLAAESGQAQIIIEKMERFVRLRPEDPLANYYLALGLSRESTGRNQDTDRIESLLQKSVHLDPKFEAGYLHLGILHFDRKEYSKAISDYQRTIALNSEMEEAHYRLAQAYKQMGDMDKSNEESRIYSQLAQKKAKQVERERHEIQQFVYSLQAKP